MLRKAWDARKFFGNNAYKPLVQNDKSQNQDKLL